MSAPKLGVLLGDRRQFYIGDIFTKWGYEVYFYGEKKEITNIKWMESFEKLVSVCEIIVVPTPFSLSEDRRRELYYRMKRGQMLFSSKIPEEVKRELKKKKVRVFDFLEQEEIAKRNAEITAEGVIAQAMIKNKGAIYESNCLVLGYGKCAKAIAKRLAGLEAKVTICSAYEAERREARKRGFSVISFENLIFEMKSQQFVFHTIPVPVMSKECFVVCNREMMVLDIVSNRMEEKIWAGECGIDYTVYPKIPEKYAPRAAAMIFSEYIRSQMTIGFC